MARLSQVGARIGGAGVAVGTVAPVTRTLPALDLTADPVTLTAALVDVASVSGQEKELADALEAALRAQAPHLEVLRSGDAVLARTNLGRPHRVLLAGHLDTVPIADNVPARRTGGIVHGCGTSDMKSGDAVFAHLAATLTEPRHDVTFVFYDCEEIEAERNGLGRIEREHRDWLDADLAILGEPTDGALEAGCQGTLRVELRTAGRRAHSARSWLGDNAIHAAGDILSRLADYRARDVEIDGCVYREGLQAVRIAGGVAGNVVPDECVVTVNFRFAPDRSAEQAVEHVREVFDGVELTVTDLSPGALPGLSAPAAAEFVTASGATPRAKYGWTDVSRFAALGIPAVNYGPGDPNLAHTREEHVAEDAVTACAAVLRRYLAP
ncbi:succinyldiaminopimelate desuccinylase [Pseudonocardia ammonioxydans]|uniref:Succinyl-diaminopimelate desuccinylase n=1 Tax=Pseudonocardia ammonioxydans TaxID=260086 RepID=A0A1I4V2S4_PSUAM|nr:succinyldiaminopimelate desuccinylase [Pseudonocardia ammonioxydans]